MPDKQNIILIGPMGTGKSTLGKLIADKTGLPHCSLDHVRYHYYEQIGYDRQTAERFMQEKGVWGLLHYWKPFEAYSVEKVLADYPNHVIDFGAGQSVYDDPVLFERVEQSLLPYRNVVLILPSEDPVESFHILRMRKSDASPNTDNRETTEEDITQDVNYHFLTHPSNKRLAKFVVYTKGQTPEQTRDEILRLTQPLVEFQKRDGSTNS